MIWAWLFNRVELDESYVYEHRFLQGTSREPIFARGLKRETKDLLELLILGAGDIQHRTKNGIQTVQERTGSVAGIGPRDRLDARLSPQRSSQDGTASTTMMPTRSCSSDAFPDLDEEMDDDGIHDDDVDVDDAH